MNNININTKFSIKLKIFGILTFFAKEVVTDQIRYINTTAFLGKK